MARPRGKSMCSTSSRVEATLSALFAGLALCHEVFEQLAFLHHIAADLARLHTRFTPALGDVRERVQTDQIAELKRSHWV